MLTLLQAPLLPAIVRFARLPADNSVAEERHFAEVTTTEAAYEALARTAEELGSDERVVDRIRHELEKRRKLLAADGAETTRSCSTTTSTPSCGSPSSRASG